MNRYLIYFFLLCFELAISQSSQIDTHISWQFRKVGTTELFPASVPGTVHTDLFANHLIKDPFFSDNEKNLQWIEQEDWEYIGQFDCDELLLKNEHIELKFEGLDTYATIFLNGKQILECNNMFRYWNKDVKQFLKTGNNTLQIIFESAVKKGKAEANKLKYTLPGDEKVFTRKAQYQYGWDFSPRFVTCGIYKPIRMMAWNDFKMESMHHIITELNKSKAVVKFISEFISDRDTSFVISMNASCSIAEFKKSVLTQNKSLQLHKGFNRDTFTYQINNPELWYANGLGKQPIYHFQFSSIEKTKSVLFHHMEIGLRTIELVRNKDIMGEQFYFKVNGSPVFMKGANYVPQDNFITRANSEKQNRLIERAKQSNMNMIRVWGGGLYPDDEFFEACDKNGILVWQDFMFACAMYPGDSAFIENVKEEVSQQICRIRHHPSLALWCGNNEVDEGWKNWGWQKQYNYSKSDSTQIWNDYVNLFQNEIPRLVKQLHPSSTTSTMPYHSSSPFIGWGRSESMKQGDAHYWGVWWGMQPFEVYQKKVGRFMSEYGFQALPMMNTLKQISDSSVLNLNSLSIKSHQKHPTGFETIDTYMKRSYPIPEDFKKYVYVSQLLQRDGLKMAIEAHRKAMPYCMGTLYWQLNDCWPGISWSTIDFNDQPKAAYFETKKLYKDVLISVSEVEDKFQIYIVSDKTSNCKALMTVAVKDFSGKIIFQKIEKVDIKKMSSTVYFSLLDTDLKKCAKNESYISVELKDSFGSILSCATYCFAKPNELNLGDPQLKIELAKDKSFIQITSKSFVKDLFLFSNDTNFLPENNFVDVEPNVPLKIKLNLGLKFLPQIDHFSLFDLKH